MPITADIKKKHLKSLSLALRHELEGYFDSGEWHAGDLEQRLMSLGVRREREALPLDEMAHLPDHDQRARKKVDQYIALRTAAGMSREGAVAEFVRETAYIWANRLLALRCMEARELIDEVILQKEVYSGRSLEHNRLLRARPELASQEDDGLFLVLEQAFTRMAKHLPLLFDPHAPSVALRPTPAVLKRCITLLSSGDGAVFKEPDALGWAYQFWNTEENKRVFEAVRLKKAKIAGADIIPATQLYTEPYMVKFLVQNSLGATWMGMHPESKLAAGWEYFVRDADRAPIAEKDRKKVADLSFLDPACGSGHFLLEAFDLLFDMYQEEGSITDEVAICQSILEKNLYGIDIDERAVQIAEAALWCKAKERAIDFTSAKTNLVATNLRLPKDKNHLQSFLDKHPEDKPLEEALKKIFAGLENADQLGSLLQIAEPVEKELRAIKEQEDKKQLAYLGNKQRTLFDAQPQSKDPSMKQFDISPQTVLPVGVEGWDTWRKQTGERLRTHFAEEAEAADLGQQFFSAQASRGWRLFELLGRRYEVVAANPPYMGSKNMGPVLRKYVEQHYASGKRDLYAAFILRSIDLCLEDGRVAMVTQQSWMFLQSFAEFRANKPAINLREGLLSGDIILSDPLAIFAKSHPEDFALMMKAKFKREAGLLAAQTVELLAHLGSRAFQEISGEIVNSVMFVIQNTLPVENRLIVALRAVALQSAAHKEKALREGNVPSYKIKQSRFLQIPQSPISYWLRERFFSLLAGKTLGDVATVCQGLATTNDARFVRFIWEVAPLEWSTASLCRRWIPFEKGGGYGKWFGHHLWAAEWQRNGCRLKQITIERYGNAGKRIYNEDSYFKPGYTYSFMARGALAIRSLPADGIFGAGTAAGIILHDKNDLPISAMVNHRLSSYLIRSISAKIQLNESYVGRVPLPESLPDFSQYENACSRLKKILVEANIHERTFVPIQSAVTNLRSLFSSKADALFLASALLHDYEGVVEALAFASYQLDRQDILSVLEETGPPSSWQSRIVGYDSIPRHRDELPERPALPAELSPPLAAAPDRAPSIDGIRSLKQRLRALYEAGPGGEVEEDEVGGGDDEEEAESMAGTRIPIPTETFLEELSQKLEIHPISVYWLLKEGIEQEGWRCIPEEQRFVTDQFTVTFLRLLGHRWPRQVEAGEAVPDWADQDGIIPITAGTQETTLYDRVRARIAGDFPGGDVASIEREFAEIMGKPLDRFIESDFFKHHTQQFKKRPIAWQIQSSKFTAKRKPAFACLLYYHKLDGDTLPKLRSQYVGPLRQRLETELRGIEAVPKDGRSDRQQSRLRELADQLTELRDFDKKLEQVQTSGFAFAKLAEQLRAEPIDAQCSPDGVRPPSADLADFLRQEQSYLPDTNDGVRVNIAPLQQAGLLAADVLAGKDLDKAITDRATWRSDERRWSRAGKLPQPGYFRVRPQPDEAGTAA